MTKHRPRSRTLASVLAAADLLAGVMLATGSASASPARPAGATRTSSGKADAGPPAGSPITSPIPGEVFTPGSDIRLSAAPFLVSDAVKDGLSSSAVTSIAFYASTSLTNNRLVGVAQSAPWTVPWNHVPAGDYSLTAVTTSRQGSTTSDPVAIQVEKPSVVTDQSSLTVARGHSASLRVSLSTAPGRTVTVRLTDAGTGTRVPRRALIFTPSDWDRPQRVTVAAAGAKTGSHSTITASAPGLGSALVAVTSAASATGYDQWFLNLYDDITNTTNGYFSPQGIPYHSVEELIVEAPDYGHETTSETYGLPIGLSISSSTGAVTGTPTTAGSYTTTVTVTDGSGASSVNFDWTIGGTGTGNTVTVTNPGTQASTVGTAVSLQIHASDSATGQALAYSAAGLPAGLSISSSAGLISGTPTTAGSSSVTVTVTDGTGAKGTASFTWTIGSGSPPPGACHVTYTPNQWQDGFTANLTLVNAGSSAINGWTLTFTFPGDQKITTAWNGVESQNGEAVTITNESYNAAIAAGNSTTLGFQGTWTSSDASPTSFSVNGIACT